MINITSDTFMIGLSVQKYFNEVFNPTQVFIATWNNVGYYEAQTDKVWSYSCVHGHALSIQLLHVICRG